MQSVVRLYEPQQRDSTAVRVRKSANPGRQVKELVLQFRRNALPKDSRCGPKPDKSGLVGTFGGREKRHVEVRHVLET